MWKVFLSLWKDFTDQERNVLTEESRWFFGDFFCLVLAGRRPYRLSCLYHRMMLMNIHLRNRSRLILHFQQTKRERNLCIGGRGRKIKSSESWASTDRHLAVGRKCAGQVKQDSPGYGDADLLSICSCEAAGEQATSAAFEDENSYVFKYDGALCSSYLGG